MDSELSEEPSSSGFADVAVQIPDGHVVVCVLL